MYVYDDNNNNITTNNYHCCFRYSKTYAYAYIYIYIYVYISLLTQRVFPTSSWCVAPEVDR